MTKTEEIFKSNGCPYDNHSQGKDIRAVFVCSAGLLRSPTDAKSIVKMLNEKNKEKVLDDAANLAVSLDKKLETV